MATITIKKENGIFTASIELGGQNEPIISIARIDPIDFTVISYDNGETVNTVSWDEIFYYDSPFSSGDALESWILLNPIISTEKEYACFYLSTGGLTGQSNTARTVVINETLVNSNRTVFTLALNEVTIKKKGDFKIDFGCYFNSQSTKRSEYTFWLEVNNLQIPGSRAGTYQRGYDSGDTADIHMTIPVEKDDVLKVVVNRTDGTGTTGYQDDNGTRLVIEEM